MVVMSGWVVCGSTFLSSIFSTSCLFLKENLGVVVVAFGGTTFPSSLLGSPLLEILW